MSTGPLATELMLVRHGEAHCNREQIIGGPTGCRGLTDHGHHQARLLAQRLRRDTTAGEFAGGFHALYTSPLPRARATADHITHALDMPATVLDDLREPHPGDADGHAWTTVIDAFVARHGDAPALHPDQPLTLGAESFNDHLHRVTATLRQLLNRHAGQRLLLVAHGDTITAAHHLLLNLDTAAPIRAGFAAHQASLSYWSQLPLRATRPDGRYRWALIRHNDTNHLTTRQDHPSASLNGSGPVSLRAAWRCPFLRGSGAGRSWGYRSWC